MRRGVLANSEYKKVYCLYAVSSARSVHTHTGLIKAASAHCKLSCKDVYQEACTIALIVSQRNSVQLQKLCSHRAVLQQ
jgi:hypothetical protein